MTRTENNKPSQSSPIRKGKMSKEQIEATAEELTGSKFLNDLMEAKVTIDRSKEADSCLGFSDCKRNSKGETTYTLTTTGSAIKTYKNIKNAQVTLCNKDGKQKETRVVTLVEAPKIEPVQKGDYKIFAETLRKAIKESGQFEATTDQLKLFFPQVRRGGEVATNLKRSYGINYRRVEGGRNDTYIFFIEPTKEELIVQLTSAESKVIELQEDMIDYNSILVRKNDLIVENSQLKSDLFYSQRSNIITLAFAIGAVITIIIKSVTL